MLDINGIQPKLEGHVCEALICQQYWYNGKRENEVDVLYIKADGRSYQLYFENGVVFWRNQQEIPHAFEQEPGSPLSYPLVDLGEKYKLKDRLIIDVKFEPLPDGVKASMEFENGGELVIYHQDNRCEIRRIAG